MRPLVIFLLVLAAFSACPAWAVTDYDLTLSFEATGLDKPESALYDQDTGYVYVSNINGSPWGVEALDGNGYVARVTSGGVVETRSFLGDAAGAGDLDAPKGMAVSGGLLYVADVETLKVFGLANASLEAGHTTGVADVRLNDVAADAEGNLYVSDASAGRIFRLADGVSGGSGLEAWLSTDSFDAANGLLVDADNNRLLVGAGGTNPGLYAVDLDTLAVTALVADVSVDGIAADGAGNFFYTDGESVFQYGADGDTVTELALSALVIDDDDTVAADIDLATAFDPDLLFVPTFSAGALRGYEVTTTSEAVDDGNVSDLLALAGVSATESQDLSDEFEDEDGFDYEISDVVEANVPDSLEEAADQSADALEEELEEDYLAPASFEPLSEVVAFRGETEGALGAGVLLFSDMPQTISHGDIKLLKVIREAEGGSVFFNRISDLDDAADLSYCVWDTEAEDCEDDLDEEVQAGGAVYVAVFIADNGAYDEDGSSGEFEDPVVIGYTDSDTDSIEDNGFMGWGCALRAGAGPDPALLLLLAGAVLLMRRAR